MSSTTPNTNTNSDALRNTTRELHERIEQHPLQKQLASAAISKENYARYLQHLHVLHTAFEARLKELADKEPFKRVLVDAHFQQEFLERDLERLSADHSDILQKSASLPETNRFGYEGTFAENDVALLGALYVLLGSKHGGKYMAHQLRSAWGREDRHEYLDPYGAEFAALWKKFVQDLNTVDQQQALLDGARATYNAFFAISDAIVPADK
ncbi:MAG: biliverdin-producing heme oxygenase [Candidatus Obscuribacterales bacterium]